MDSSQVTEFTGIAMYVCICKAVRQSDIVAAVDRGVRDMRALVRETGCSSQCGRCARTALDTLAGAVEDRRPFLTVVPSERAA